MKHVIKEITKIVLYDKKTDTIILEAKPTTQPITIWIGKK